jgi:hypothetical protein
LHGSYAVSIFLSPEGRILGNNTLQTVNGVVVFDNLQILTSGSYKLIVFSPGFDYNISTSEFFVAESMLSSIELLVPESVSIYFDFDIEILLKDQSGALLDSNCSVELIGSSTIYGTTSGNSISGTLILTIYVKETGFINITALTALGINNTVQVNSLQVGLEIFVIDDIVTYI